SILIHATPIPRKLHAPPTATSSSVFHFFLNATPPTAIYTLSLHDALPIFLFIAAGAFHTAKPSDLMPELQGRFPIRVELDPLGRSEEHTSELQSRENLVCRLLLEKKKKK